MRWMRITMAITLPHLTIIILVGVVSLFHEGTDFQFRKFAVATDEQGKGTGTILLNYVLDFAIAMGAKRIWCNSRVTLLVFTSGLDWCKPAKLIPISVSIMK
jgi:GNAT superfamily N-acetyltransferase